MCCSPFLKNPEFFKRQIFLIVELSTLVLESMFLHPGVHIALHTEPQTSTSQKQTFEWIGKQIIVEITEVV